MAVESLPAHSKNMTLQYGSSIQSEERIKSSVCRTSACWLDVVPEKMKEHNDRIGIEIIVLQKRQKTGSRGSMPNAIADEATMKPRAME